MASSNPQGEVSASTRNSPGAPAESPIERRTVRETGRVSDQVHTRQPPQRTQPKFGAGGPRRDNPIAGPRTGTTRSEPSVPASAGASGRHHEPGSRPASACPAQPPSKAGGPSPRAGHHGVGKADRSTESNRTERGMAHHAGPRGTPERHAAGQNQGTQTGAKPQRPPGAANPESAHNAHQTTAQEQLPMNTSRRLDGRVHARRVPRRYRLRTATVRMDECAPGECPAPTGYEQPPSRWTSARQEGTQPLPATNSRRPDGRVSAPQQRPAHATPHAQPKAQHTEQTHRCTRAKRPRTPYTQHNPRSGRTGEQEPSGPGHRTRNTTHRASTPVNGSQVAQETAHAKQHTERAHR